MEARHPHQHEARERIGAVVPTTGYDVVIEAGGSESALSRAVEWPGWWHGEHLGAYDPGTVWPMEAAFSKEVALAPLAGLLQPLSTPRLRRGCRPTGRPPGAHHHLDYAPVPDR